MKNLLLITVAILVTQCTRDQNHSQSIHYPEPAPDSVALTFLPGIVSNESNDSLDFNASFSPDGKRFYFSRSAQRKWRIYMTELREEGWSKPELAPFNESEYSQADPFVDTDGTVYYISNRPRDANDTLPDYDIWFTRPQTDGSWSKPENPKHVNSDSTEYYVSRAANGNLYFASNRAGTMGDHDIYVSHFKNGEYTIPENLGLSINSAQMEHDPMISPDEQFLIFTSVDRTDAYGEGDLYYALRNADGSWSAAKNMGARFNTPTYEYCSYLTPDGQYFFYSSAYDVKWISTKYFPWKVLIN